MRVLTAEYIISLGNLTFETFSNAIREKYEDLYFEEDLVVNLFDAVNGRRPVAERRSVDYDDVTVMTAVLMFSTYWLLRPFVVC